MEEGNSLGAQVRLVIDGLPVGLGDPVFAKFEAKLAETAGIAVATLRTRYKKLLEEHPV